MLKREQTVVAELRPIAAQIRGALVEMSHRAGTAHLGSSLSCVDIVVACYWGVLALDPRAPGHPDRDRFILSKGHAATTLYAALAYRGLIPLELLGTYAEPGGRLAEHPSPGCLPGVEVATGSLGHGLPVGVGMALAARIQRRPYSVYVVMSDGECNEGSVWEAAMFAPAQRLERLVVVIDYNKWQATGRSEEIMALAPLARKWEAFGWDAVEVDGHDLEALVAALSRPTEGRGRPRAVIAHTVKGRGVSFMEDDNNWHYRVPSADEVRKARKELGLE
jgi:transketolase